MQRARRARIVATLGPASRAPGTVKALAQAGVDVFRLNFSHGSHDDHAAAFKAVRGAEMALKRPLGILADLQGPKLRLGRFSDVEIEVKPGHQMRFDLNPARNTRETLLLPIAGLEPFKQPGVYLAVMREAGSYSYSQPATLFSLSDIGLSAHRYRDRLDVFTQALEGGKAQSGVQLELLDGSGALLAEGKTDSAGHAQLPPLPAQ